MDDTPATPRAATSSARPDPARRVERVRAAERRIAAVARVLDDLIPVPGTGRRVGLEPIIGLVPGVGDLASALVAAWIVAEAARFRLPGVVLARMIVNVVVDLAVGAVPLVGDAFDFAFKANARNVELFRRHARDPDADATGHAAFLAGLLVAGLGVAWLAVVLLARLLSTEVAVP